MFRSHVAGLVLALLVVSPVLAQGASRDDTVLDVAPEGGADLDADKLLALWSKKLQVPIVRDPQLSGVHVALDNHLTWGATRRMLDLFDVVIEERAAPGGSLLFAHVRRNLPCKAAPPYPLVKPDELLGHANEIVSTVIPVVNGAGMDIFAMVRGCLVRDVNRIGNILYLRETDQILIVDFGANADYYVKLIKALDVPGGELRVVDLTRASAEDVAAALEPIAEPGTKVVAAPRKNQLVLRGGAAEVARLVAVAARLDGEAGASCPRFRAEPPTLPLWKLATLFAAVAFLGQTILLRRFQRSARLTKLPA